jgi:hypothetical protein
LVATILVIGLIVGQTTLRDNVVTELSDTADAISAIDQSYEWSLATGHSSSTAGSEFNDAADFCDASNNGAQGQNALLSGTCVVLDANDSSPGSQTTAGAATAN